MASAASVASSRSVFHDDTLIRIAVAPPHWVGPHHIRPSFWISAMRASVVGPSTKRTSTWFRTTSFRTMSPPLAEPLGDRLRGVARPHHQVFDDRRHGRAPAGRTTPRPTAPAAKTGACGAWPRTRRWSGGSPPWRRTSAGDRPPADEGDATVVGDVQPLVPVRRPGVGPIEPAHEVGPRPGRRGPTVRTHRRRAANRIVRPTSRRSRRRDRMRRC